MKGLKSLWITSFIFLNSCAQSDPHFAKAILSPTEGSAVHGQVTFTKVKDGIQIIADVYGLTPGQHGFHIHEHGDCSAADGSSAGAHYNPTHKKHGCPEDLERHVGDFGNLNADQTGYAHYDRVDRVIQLSGPYAIIGKSLIVHEKRDDCTTQPTGDSGKRIACGVIQK
jgi:Cu-Zn family superoxide dismutase